MVDGKEIAILIMRLVVSLVYMVYCLLETLVKTLLPRKYRRKDIRGNVVLVTGGASGIGRLMCIKLAARGAIVVTWDVDEKGNIETARQVVAAGGQCRAYCVDLCDRRAIYTAATKVKQEVGKVDVLINNAGIVTGKKFLDSSDENIIRTFEVNTLSHFWTTKAFLADMMARNEGHIVTIASAAGKIPCNSLVDYCSSKYAAVGFNEALQLELKVEGKTGIQMTLVCPVLMGTTMFQGAHSRYFPILQPDWVAGEVVDGMLMNSSVLILPCYMRLLFVLKELLPEKLQFHLNNVFAITSLMDNFTGKKMES